jgi:hypothetical protein
MRSEPRADDFTAGEPRWPMASAVIAAMVLTALLPEALRAGPRLLLPVLEGLLLVALIAGDPGKIDRRSSALRALSIGLAFVLVVGALWATVALIDDLIDGGSTTDSASNLLEAGSVVWVLNIVAFALVYWELDGGGAAARTFRAPAHPDFAFPQQLSPELAPAGWRPRFADYLYLAFTNATAFSPTDAMPLAPWSKLTMAVQSLISIAILGLVIARAVNIFT